MVAQKKMKSYSNRTRISSLDVLSNRSKNALRKAGIRTVGALHSYVSNGGKVSKIKGVGEGSMTEIESLLREEPSNSMILTQVHPSHKSEDLTILCVGGSLTGSKKSPKSLVKKIHQLAQEEFEEDSKTLLTRESGMSTLLKDVIRNHLDSLKGETWILDGKSPMTPLLVEALEPYADLIFRG